MAANLDSFSSARASYLVDPTTGAPVALPTSAGAQAGAASMSVVPATDAKFVGAQKSGLYAGAPTYSAFTTASFPSYATPTDVCRISGSASKTVAVLQLILFMQATATGVMTTNLDFIKRSTATTGGSPTAVAGIAYDSTFAAPTATVEYYGAAPGALGTSLGVMRRYINPSATINTTAMGSGIGLTGNVAMPGLGLTAFALTQPGSPIILRGVAEGLTINLNSVALPAGFAAFLGAEWVEF